MDDIFGALRPYLTALVIGFIIGLERERAHRPNSQPIGMRTLSLVGLLGAFSASVESVIVGGAIAVFVFAAILSGYLRSTRERSSHDIGLTTEMATAVVFCLGFISKNHSVIALALGALTLGLLAGRDSLHRFTREKITPEEIRAFFTLIILGVAILPFLPKEAVDPWGIFEPFKLGSLVFILAVVQFLSYALLKIFGHRAGTVLGGFLAGFASSTAAFANIRQQLSSADRSTARELLVYGVMAIFASTLQSVAIIGAGAPELFARVIWGFGAVFLCCLITAVVGVMRASASDQVKKKVDQDPLNLKKQMTFAAMLFLIIAATNFAKNYVGDSAFIGVSFLSGLFELQGVTFSLSSLPFSENVLIATAAAFLASLISKSVLILSAEAQYRWAKVFFVGVLSLLACVFVAGVIISKP